MRSFRSCAIALAGLLLILQKCHSIDQVKELRPVTILDNQCNSTHCHFYLVPLATRIPGLLCTRYNTACFVLSQAEHGLSILELKSYTSTSTSGQTCLYSRKYSNTLLPGVCYWNQCATQTSLEKCKNNVTVGNYYNIPVVDNFSLISYLKTNYSLPARVELLYCTLFDTNCDAGVLSLWCKATSSSGHITVRSLFIVAGRKQFTQEVLVDYAGGNMVKLPTNHFIYTVEVTLEGLTVSVPVFCDYSDDKTIVLSFTTVLLVAIIFIYYVSFGFTKSYRKRSI